MMCSMECSWSRLPDEIGERVLSLLPVPALCRCRSVCKAWNELFRKRSFLDLCDLNGRSGGYLFVTRHSIDYAGWSWVDDVFRRTMCFLDLDEKRWYAMPVEASPLASTDGNVPRLLAAMDDGLVCELSALRGGDEDYSVVLFDPVAKSRWELPVSTYEDGPICGLVGDSLPAILTVLDNATRTFKVFVMNSPTAEGLDTRFFLYESVSGAWRGLPDPPERLGERMSVFHEREREESVVFFRGDFYTIFWYHESRTVLLLSYNLEKNEWREVLAFPHRSPGYPQLHVTGNRLFVSMWMDYTWRLPVRVELLSSCANELDVTANADEQKDTYEIKEIFSDENSSSARLMVQISGAELYKALDNEPWNGLQVVLTNGFPHKTNSSVVFISALTGKSVTYDVGTKSFGALPAHPLKQDFLELEEHDSDDSDEEYFPPLYRSRFTALSLRNLLNQ